MNKTQKTAYNTRKTGKTTWKKRIVQILTWPFRMCRKLWNWLKSIDIIGMINLTLLVVIIILFSVLIIDFVRYNRYVRSGAANRYGQSGEISAVADKKQSKDIDSRKVTNRTFKTTLPIRADKQTNIKPKIRTIGVDKPEVVKELSLPANELPKQVLSGDVIVDNYPSSPVLSNGVKINGNLIIQNTRKYTIPCDAKINGHLFIRNARVNFCGKFTVNGNIYVTRGSAFGAIPENAKVNGQIIL